ncbi:Centrosomal protein [Schistosoma japonicum]|uniref:Centrosomal protein n=1 Tax=Schistosoma japonicum TaxID=6182 RepID=A0A4Z2DB24_SCHJA|nr:Centrosomal protein [Schistosoma japonicum]
MTGTYAAAHVKFAKLRKRLDQLGYKQPLGLDSLPLVERLFYDLVWTTENLRKARTELSSQIQIRSTVEDYIAPYKADNGRLIRENNEINRHLMILRQDYEENIRGLKGECRRLENVNEDMKYFNSQCLDKIHSYEREAKRMVEQILYLQEKNFQAVVYTPDGGKKQLPFRRQRMDIDSLAPLSKEAKTLNNEKYCCSIAHMWEKDNVEYSPKTYNLLEITTKRCEELENQMHNLEEELELNEKKVENFRQQVILRDSEIERLRNISERGRPLEAVLNDSTEKQTDRLIHQLQIQTDLLQTRNAELESRIVDLVNREVPDMQTSITLVSKECQTTLLPEPVLVNNSSQTNSVNATIYEDDSNSAAVFRVLQSKLLGLQTERDHYRDELDKMINEFHQLHTPTNKCSDKDDTICSEDEMKCLRQERNDLISLLDHFERQLHDIQGNVRVLTHERDMLLQELSQIEKQQLQDSEQNNKLSCDPIISNQHVISHSSVQNLNNTVDGERDEAIKKLHHLTADRDSLQERLHTLTIEYNNEKAHLIHCLENNKSELNDIKETKSLLEQRVTELLRSFIDKQTECDRLIEKVNCLEKHQSNNDHTLFIEQNLQVVQVQLEKVQKDYEKCRNECTSLHVTLRQIDQEKDHLQTCLDERTERCIALERQIVTYETNIKELKVTTENSEKRILRLTQSVIERETENHELVERLSKSECDLKSTSKNLELTTKELEKTKNEMNRLKNETQNLQSELTSSYDKQSELDKRVVDFDKELTNLRNMYTIKEQERIDLLKEYGALGLQLDEKVTLINRLECQLNELNQKYSTQDKESLNLNQQLQHHKKECQDYAQVVQSLEVQVLLPQVL